MINVLSVCGLVLCIVIINKLLENYSKEYIILITICASIIILIYVSGYISTTLDFLNQLLEVSSSSDIYSVLLKALGICIVTNLSVDICKDSNQNALSSVVLITGKIAILLISIPLLKELYTVVSQLINS